MAIVGGSGFVGFFVFFILCLKPTKKVTWVPVATDLRILCECWFTGQCGFFIYC